MSPLFGSVRELAGLYGGAVTHESFAAAELRELARKIQSPTGRRLLWEISRLRQIARQADRLERCINAGPDSIDAAATGIAAEELRKLLDALPWLLEERAKPSRR